MTKIALMASSLFFASVGALALFAPNELAISLNLDSNPFIAVLIQLFGAAYLSLALMNWTAKDSPIGGIYARPISLANFAHFFIGVLVLVKLFFASQFNPALLVIVIFFALLAVFFGWLVFMATGLAKPADS